LLLEAFLDAIHKKFPKIVPGIAALLREVPHPTVPERIVFAELQHRLDDSIGYAFDQAQISRRGRHNILSVCLGNKIRLDEELQSFSPGGRLFTVNTHLR
jgi:hypothetical protein